MRASERKSKGCMVMDEGVKNEARPASQAGGDRLDYMANTGESKTKTLVSSCLIQRSNWLHPVMTFGSVSSGPNVA